MDIYITSSGQRLRVHDLASCTGPACVVHRPSKHHMRSWPTVWRSDRFLMERICKHGVGHPDPDDASIVRTHGCCGCCAPLT